MISADAETVRSSWLDRDLRSKSHATEPSRVSVAKSTNTGNGKIMPLIAFQRTTAKPLGGDNDFAIALAKLKPFLFAIARTLTFNREFAEDLAQETLLKAWRARDSFAPGTNLKAWLRTILKNEYYTSQRGAWRQSPWLPIFDETMSSPAGEQQAAVSLCQTACAINFLSDEQREALILVGIFGFSYEETAMLLGTTLGTLKSHISRARALLTDILQSGPSERIKLHHAAAEAFAKWLVQLEHVRVIASHAIAAHEFKTFRRSLRRLKIAVGKPMTGWDSIKIDARAPVAVRRAMPVPPSSACLARRDGASTRAKLPAYSVNIRHAETAGLVGA
jgi:RNA polymerase sigma-70 factor (ECF subfamily)